VRADRDARHAVAGIEDCFPRRAAVGGPLEASIRGTHEGSLRLGSLCGDTLDIVATEAIVPAAVTVPNKDAVTKCGVDGVHGRPTLPERRKLAVVSD